MPLAPAVALACFDVRPVMAAGDVGQRLQAEAGQGMALICKGQLCISIVATVRTTDVSMETVWRTHSSAIRFRSWAGIPRRTRSPVGSQTVSTRRRWCTITTMLKKHYRVVHRPAQRADRHRQRASHCRPNIETSSAGGGSGARQTMTMWFDRTRVHRTCEESDPPSLMTCCSLPATASCAYETVTDKSSISTTRTTEGRGADACAVSGRPRFTAQYSCNDFFRLSGSG